MGFSLKNFFKKEAEEQQKPKSEAAASEKPTDTVNGAQAQEKPKHGDSGVCCGSCS